MKTASLFCFSLILISISSQKIIEEDGCVWNYKCCEFKEDKNGVVTCISLCEPVITCETIKEPEDTNQAEVFEEPSVQLQAISTFSLNANHICRKGFRLDSKGNCKRVLGPVVEKTTPANNDQ